MRRVRIIVGILLLAMLGAPVGRALSDELDDAERELKAALKREHIGDADLAIQQIRSIGGADAAELLISYAKKMSPTDEILYWRFANGASSLRDHEGLARVAKAILARRGALSRDLLYAMQNNRSFHVPTAIHRAVLLKAPTDLALMSVDQLAAIETVEAVDVLVEALKKHEQKAGELASR
ncbi:hypothetical protein ACFL59_02075, partial [Planctomycetota bacterium]